MPDRLGGLPVCGIGDRVFAGRTDLTVVLPEGLTVFGADAFGDVFGRVQRIEVPLDSLTARSLPSGVRFRDPGSPAFGLTRLDGVLGLILYDGEPGIVTVPDGVEAVFDRVFADLAGAAEVFLPESVTSVGNFAFASRTAAVTVHLPDHIDHIGTAAFGDGGVYPHASLWCACGSATAALLDVPFRDPSFPACVLGWRDGALTLIDADERIRPVAIPEEVAAIAEDVIGKLPLWTLPADLEEVGAGAFAGCPANRVYVPDSVRSVGASAFAGCANLLRIRLPDGPVAIDDSCLDGCPRVTVTAPAGSEALAWARRMGLPCEEE